MHHPVLLKEVIEGLNIKPNGLYIDATAGEGGHMVEIAKRGGKVLGIDCDYEQIKRLTLNVQRYKNIRIVQGNFAYIEKIAKENNFFLVDGILFDLGLSMNQLENSRRGFSYKKMDEPLDMRIDTTLSATASNVVNELDQQVLYEILSRYGEEINSLIISKEIVKRRQKKKIQTVVDLITTINKALGYKKNETHARIFQALRIAVNDELENLKKGLDGSLKILKNGGRIVVISFHSLEDRIVKQFIRNKKLRQINKKIIISINQFTFERSAKLRIIGY
ncbi:16S rRNA (cytosine(1402)-N(4))-methyltransferase RsmH [Candidatus Roizmanbacteria bacterium]|nr:16S rRNA (cytosine(1402)-N(4))-methyltransferase RsmH [Candidatus Roizmanbacteria bacterium]